MSRIYRILLLEDLPSDAYLIERQLKKSLGSIETGVADNKEDFQELFDSLKPDIVLSDYSIPGFDWSAAFKYTREKSPGTPFLIVSSSTNPTIVNGCLQAGVSGFVSKDHLHELAATILDLLGKNTPSS